LPELRPLHVARVRVSGALPSLAASAFCILPSAFPRQFRPKKASLARPGEYARRTSSTVGDRKYGSKPNSAGTNRTRHPAHSQGATEPFSTVGRRGGGFDLPIWKIKAARRTPAFSPLRLHGGG